MNLQIKIILLLITVAFIFSCKAKQNFLDSKTNQGNNKIIEDAINKHFTESDSILILPNNNNDYILYMNDISHIDIILENKISLFIHDTKKNEIIYTNLFEGSTISWFDDYSLLLTRYTDLKVYFKNAS